MRVVWIPQYDSVTDNRRSSFWADVDHVVDELVPELDKHEGIVVTVCWDEDCAGWYVDRIYDEWKEKVLWNARIDQIL